MKRLLLSLGVLLLMSLSVTTQAQNLSKDKFGKGLTIDAADSSFAVKFGFRFQTLYVGEMNAVTNAYEDNFLTRRARLKFDGFAYNPAIQYKVELALSNRDHSSGQIDESKNTANIVLDAVMKWDFTDNWSIWFGQTKLPGNRERVISSQKLQFVDRSLVNSRFNLDRDLGVQLHHTSKTGGMVWNQAIAVSMGEGRNITEPNPGGGYEFTGRIEFLPFGDFSGGGDYFGSDLKRENTPKLSIGVSGDMNYNSTRVNGNLGKFLIDSVGDYVTNDLGSVFADMMFKYKGFSAMSEYAYRTTLNANNGFGTGTGFVFQAGYLLPSNWELAARYTDIQKATGSALKEQTEYTLGLSRYVVGHNLKVQTDISYDDFAASDNQWMFRFQTELAF